MAKLGFTIPEKLIVPTVFFTIGNFLASDIQVSPNAVTFVFDPTSLGILSEKVLDLMPEINHPPVSREDSGFSITADQNLANALIMEMIAFGKEFSMR